MFEACIKITENEMTWSELKTLCEEKGLKIITLALTNSSGKTVPGSSIVLPPDAKFALHFKTAETDLGSGSETAEMKVLAVSENQVHGIRSGGI
jgi:hypothetical protein